VPHAALFAAVRATMVRQQSAFLTQLAELHKVARVQAVLWAELLATQPADMHAACAAAGFAGAGPTGPLPALPAPGVMPGAAPAGASWALNPQLHAVHPSAVPRPPLPPEPAVSREALRCRLVSDMTLLLNVPRGLRGRVGGPAGVGRQEAAVYYTCRHPLRPGHACWDVPRPPTPQVLRSAAPSQPLPLPRAAALPGSAGGGGGTALRPSGSLLRPAASKLYTLVPGHSGEGPVSSEQPSVVQVDGSARRGTQVRATLMM
jgi:hypothetical protein